MSDESAGGGGQNDPPNSSDDVNTATNFMAPSIGAMMPLLPGETTARARRRSGALHVAETMINMFPQPRRSPRHSNAPNQDQSGVNLNIGQQPSAMTEENVNMDLASTDVFQSAMSSTSTSQTTNPSIIPSEDFKTQYKRPEAQCQMLVKEGGGSVSD